MKDATYNVRVKFEHGNPLSLDLKGCGNLYLLPNKEYFFENAPIQFISYIKQLRRLGITYSITNDKKGCYMTVGLTHYLDTIAQRVMGEVRANLSVNPPEITRAPREEKKSKKDKEIEKEIPDLIPKSTFAPNKVEELNIEIKPKEVEETIPTTQIENTPEASNDVEPKVEDTKVPEDIDVESITNKSQLIEYAHSLGLTEVSDIWTKKEIRNAITKLKEDK